MIKGNKLCLPSILLSFVLAGCTTQPSQKTAFYRLAIPGEDPTQASGLLHRPITQPLIGIGPVALADYLNRPQIIRRLSPHRLELQDFHHWAGKLQDNITLALEAALQLELGESRVVAYPWHRAVEPAYELLLDVNRLDAYQGQVLLQVRWTLIDAREGRVLDLQQVSISEPLRGPDTEAMVAAASRALQQLARQLAGRLQAHL
jgi:hypothetical protein